jgi:lambda repressor-like predicted transcriptional regulator
VSECGTNAGYWAHRRAGTDYCEPCKRAHALETKRWKYERAHGLRRVVPADKVRDHVDKLRAAGMSRGSIAHAAGISRTTLDGVYRNPGKGMHITTARKIMAVKGPIWLPVGRNDETFVPRLGSVRRIQALLAIGWTHQAMKAHSGITTAVTLNQKGEWITVRTHAAIAAMFDELSMKPGPSELSRRRNTRRGYAPPLAWDEGTIDDPKAKPHGAEFGSTLKSRVDIAEIIELREQGYTLPQIAERVGVCRETVIRRLKAAA